MAFIPNIDREEIKTKSLIDQIFSKDLIKMLYYHACRVDIDDNNDKAEMIAELLGPEFQELGTGTNRIAFLYNPGPNREFRGGAGLIFEIALDRRGLIDNFTEFKRSNEAPEYFVKCYETNMLILVEEYVTLFSQNEFIMNENGIKTILEDLSKRYIFEDIGFDLKNYENYGYRTNDDIVILDTGYIYNITGNEDVFICPKCSAHLSHNQNYTGFTCDNPQCKTKYNFLDLRRRMNLELENSENAMISQLNKVEMPDFERLNESSIY